VLKEDGFLGSGATLGADINLLAYILLLIPLMLIGFYFARGKKFRNHKYVMTLVTLINWILIALIMAVSYSDNVSPGIPERLKDNFFLSPSVHAGIALSAQILATYLVLRMWFEKRLPDWMMIKNFKPWMRLTLLLWIAAAGLGILTYGVWYMDDEALAEVQSNEVSMQNFAFNPNSLTIEVGTEVTWINNEPAPHTVTFDDGSVDSGEMLQGDRFSHTFTEVGEYALHCDYHGGPGGGMAMTVIVVESLEAALPAEVSTEEATPSTATEVVETQIVMEQFEFSPAEITIPAGTTLSWINNDSAPHTVIFDDGSVDSDRLDQGMEFSYTFDTPGTYPIYCAYHGGVGGVGMSMTVTVVAGGGEPAETEEAQLPAVPTPTPAPPIPTTPLVEVYMVNQIFAPRILTVPAGTTVIWINREARVHTVTFDDGSVDSGDIPEGGQFQYTFTTPGTYPLYCRYHGGPNGLGMAMTITVE
jgi:plastocyanin/uncharacterized membrane protein YozB (DUF420 family)